MRWGFTPTAQIPQPLDLFIGEKCLGRGDACVAPTLASIDGNSLSFGTYSNSDGLKPIRTVVIYFVRLGLLRTVGVYSVRWGFTPTAQIPQPFDLFIGEKCLGRGDACVAPCILRLRKT